MRYVFPAIFEQAEEGGFNVRIPDVPGCFTQGDTLAEAIYMAQDALAMMIVYYEDHGNEIPASSSLEDIKSGKAIVSYVLADTDQWRRNNDNRAVKKTLSIPSWLNAKASRAGVNFSQVLQEALVSKLS
ncbi:MAG: type II toxin-antitoxin system HicB family antitoxin [Spirochaetales bacterium]|nr:type II toxin-antitoxin system HicB family antitoxin [Spirochaetales bacterium]